jgi:Zn-dependent alcohol dehydrogenase
MTVLNFGGTRGLDDSPVRLPDGSFVRGQFFGQSSFSELAIVDVRSVVKYDGPMEDLAFLAPMGCGYQTGSGTILNVLRPGPDQSIAIFGLGAVGLAALMAVKSMNIETIVAVDIVDAKLGIATSLGATYTINSKTQNVYEAIRAIDPEGIDFVVDTTGLGHMVNDGVRALRHKGTLALVGTPKPSETLQINALDLLMACKTIVGVVEGDSDPLQVSWHLSPVSS